MMRSLLAGAMVLGLAACGTSAAKDAPPGTEADAAPGRSTTATAATAERSLESGTRVAATIQTALSSRTNKVGETVRALVSADVMDARGRVVIPTGSTVRLTVAQLEPGSSQIRPEGRLSLVINSIEINGATQSLSGTLEPVAHHLEGRGITKDEALRVGAGTAVGAIAGQVIGKNQKSTVLGGAIGAVAGTAVAVRYAYRDVVVSAGTPIVFTLTQALSVVAR